MHIVGLVVRHWRDERGVSRTELAAKIGIAERTVRGWETGSSSPRGSELITLANAFGLSLSEFFKPADAIITTSKRRPRCRTKIR